jgi:glycosyltransferase involved in cell wall biosynthesis
VYLEHNAPQGRINEMLHPLAGREDIAIVHVTHFNALFWDTGSTQTTVVEHGVPDPGYRYTGTLARCAASINEAKRRHRVVGNDLLPQFERIAPVDVFGIGTAFALPTDRLHDEMAQRRAYLHPYRWTSLGLSLLEAMHLGMPVVALATTEAPYAVPADAGIVSNRMDTLLEAVEWLMRDEPAARAMGLRARAHALERYNVERFLNDWDAVLERTLNRSELPTTNKLDTPIAAAAKIGCTMPNTASGTNTAL